MADEKAPQPELEIAEPIKRSPVLLSLRIFLVIFLIDTAYALLTLVPLSGTIAADWVTSYDVFLWIAHTAKSLIMIYMVIVLVLNWIRTTYFVTHTHLVRRRELLRLEESTFPLSEIEMVRVDQSPLGRWLNFGTITITFVAARQREEIRLFAVQNPKRYHELFSSLIT